MRLVDCYMRLKHSRLAWILNNHPNHPANFDGLPKTIWIYWDEGVDAAPPVVQICVESWRILNQEWTIRLLDNRNVAEFVDMSDLDICDVPIQKYANLLRTRLLKSHGGVWCDATLLCTKPLDHWLPLLMQTDCFFFSAPGRNRILSNWFIASMPNGGIISEIDDFYTDYLTNPSPYNRPGHRSPPYFNYHFSIEYMVRTKLRFRKQFGAIPRISALALHELQERMIAKDAKIWDHLDHIATAPVHKLTWKHDIDCDELRRLVARLDPALGVLTPGPGDERDTAADADKEQA